MLLESTNYKPSMARFLNNFSKKAKGFEPPVIAYLEQLFESFLTAAESLPSEAFVSTRTNRFSIALFEAVFTAVASRPYGKGQLVMKKIPAATVRALDLDATFVESSEKASADKVNVDKRLARAEVLLAQG